MFPKINQKIPIKVITMTPYKTLLFLSTKMRTLPFLTRRSNNYKDKSRSLEEMCLKLGIFPETHKKRTTWNSRSKKLSWRLTLRSMKNKHKR